MPLEVGFLLTSCIVMFGIGVSDILFVREHFSKSPSSAFLILIREGVADA